MSDDVIAETLAEIADPECREYARTMLTLLERMQPMVDAGRLLDAAALAVEANAAARKFNERRASLGIAQPFPDKGADLGN
jgi:hypothetical protein